ncbi:hypothetical protein LWI28_027690 [Acer negundo]|uniref:ABC transmembrane type-1 domain-containing protein n=1 Tax=Acer negundo TaxID=4023 RepID=A0AAD5P276_ACENE|nr:hypothetical protein LWI28_027690 [Acer negundo]
MDTGKMKENQEAEQNGEESNEDDQNQKVSFYKLFTFADRLDVIMMIVGTLSAITGGLAQPLMSVIFGEIVDSFGTATPDNVVGVVSKASLKFVYLAIAAGIAAFLRGKVYTTDVNFSWGLRNRVKGWQIAIVLLGCIPLMAIAGGFMSLLMAKMSSRGQIAYAEAGNVVDQTVGGIRTVTSFTGEKRATDNYNKKLEVAYAASVKQGRASGLGLGVVMLVVFSTYGLAIWYGSKLIIEQGYNGGRVINVIMAILTGGMSLGQTSPCVNAFAAGKAAAYKMFETIKRKPKIDPYDYSGMTLENFEGEIEFKDVHFRYPARPDVQIFSGFSLHVPNGLTAALVGQSGSGKSTVISLLERFYDPHSGEVLMDGVNIKNLQLRWLRHNIGLVGQEPILFVASMKENIAYGKENATDDEIRRAIALANAAKFIDKLPQVYSLSN